MSSCDVPVNCDVRDVGTSASAGAGTGEESRLAGRCREEALNQKVTQIGIV